LYFEKRYGLLQRGRCSCKFKKTIGSAPDSAVVLKRVFVPTVKTSWVDVIRTIFCDFRQVSATILAFFSNTNIVINFCKKLAVAYAKKCHFLAQ
jgi:hypothetical protein